jgi:hypothetical protein
MSVPDDSYDVVYSEAVRQQLLDLCDEVKQSGRGPEILECLEEIDRRLKANPSDFGEPLFHLKKLGGNLRKAVRPPLAVCFGVYELERLVVVFWFKALSGTGS